MLARPNRQVNGNFGTGVIEQYGRPRPRYSREGGNPLREPPELGVTHWIPAFAGMTCDLARLSCANDTTTSISVGSMSRNNIPLAGV